MTQFKLISKFKPTGDQPQAIEKLVEGVKKGYRYQTLLGITGSGKTFTIANVIAQVNKPTLVISHNKTLAAQLYGEFKAFFPENAVEYFISYYDYYQPEAYIPQTDTYIEKDASINDEIDRLRLKATSALLERKDVIIVASVSCIYGLGSPGEFKKMIVRAHKGDNIERDIFTAKLVDIHYTRNDVEFARGTFRCRGDVLEVRPSHEEYGIRIEFFGDTIESIKMINPQTMDVIRELDWVHIYPAKHFVMTRPQLEEAIKSIEAELEERVKYFKSIGKFVEAQRLLTRTKYDIELLREIGYCPGVENYSRHLSGRAPGERPACLLDYFPEDFLVIIDESHMTVPQLMGMYRGDRARKEVLVEYGFRLPSALDNRPLKFEEFLALVPQIIFTSATPGPFEYKHSKQVVEQIIRPTGLLEPKVSVRPTKGQIDDLINEIRNRTKRGERVLVTTLTKRMAEDLADYLARYDIKVRYLHSEIDAIDRVDLLRGLRLREFDCIVGVNLLREGLDLPEVSLVVILDADKEGFLRSFTSLIQIAGRAARNVGGEVILYADKVTDAMKKFIEEAERRRRLQMEYNKKHGIVPKTIYKTREEILKTTIVADADKLVDERLEEILEERKLYFEEDDIKKLEEEMRRLAKELRFEEASKIRDKIRALKGELPVKLQPEPAKRKPKRKLPKKIKRIKIE